MRLPMRTLAVYLLVGACAFVPSAGALTFDLQAACATAQNDHGSVV